MIITKMALPRRTFLRGMGAAFALPLLDAMVPAFSAALKSAARPVTRMGFVYVPNGVAMNDALNYWTPKGTGAEFEFSPILAPLAPYRDRLTIVSGLAQKQGESLGDGNGEHTRACATWLAGVHPKKTEGADIRLTTTADQIAAAQLGKDTVLPSMEIDCIRNRSRARRPVRGRIQLRLHEHGVVAVADDPASGREQPERRVRSAVRRRRHAGRASRPHEEAAQPSRSRQRRSRAPAAIARSRRPRERDRIFRCRAGSRAADSDGGRAEQQLDAACSRSADRHSRRGSTIT